MSGFNVEFKFSIGDIVFIRSAQHSMGARPNQFIVIERIAQQCPDGIQLQYKLQGTNATGSYLELVLSKEEPPYRSMSDEAVADRVRLATAEREAATRLWDESLKEHKEKAKKRVQESKPYEDPGHNKYMKGIV